MQPDLRGNWRCKLDGSYFVRNAFHLRPSRHATDASAAQGPSALVAETWPVCVSGITPA